MDYLFRKFGVFQFSAQENALFSTIEDEKRNSSSKAEALDSKFDELSSEDADILRQQLAIVPSRNMFFKMYKYATAWDMFLVFLGLSMAVIHGAGMPMFTLVLGGLSNNFNGFVTGSTESKEFLRQVDKNSLFYVYIGAILIFTSTAQSYLLNSCGEVLASRYRKHYMKAIISQNIAYFDNLGSGQVTTQLINDTMAIQNAVGEKSGMFLTVIATCISAFAISFAQNWRLALILCSSTFVVFTCMSLAFRATFGTQRKSSAIYGASASIAEEALGSIRTTVAFSSQSRILKRFDTYLQRHNFWHNRVHLMMAIAIGITWIVNFWTYSLGYWEGSRLLVRGKIDVGKLIAVISSTAMGTMQIGSVTPMLQHFVKGITSCATLNKTIERNSNNNSLNASGTTLSSVQGDIEFRNIRFRYPSRPDVSILKDFSLRINAGQTVALVGTSGSGKSTLISLFERFYIPMSGQVTLDGVDISEMDIQWLRKQIGYVSQEPTLFAETVYANVLYGLHSHESLTEDVKVSLVTEALKQSNAWDFVCALPEGLYTNVGDKGALLSGGQKQRIAIARAIVSAPKILLLDEATSALDTVSEGIVQDALDKASLNRTTIVVAHRLSTIRNADNIVVMSEGNIIEQGTHNDLLKLDQTYAKLVKLQEVDSHLAVHETTLENPVDDKKPFSTIISTTDDDQETDGKLSPCSTELARDAATKRLDKTPSLFEVLRMLLHLNSKHWKLSVIAMFFAILQGYGFPSLSLVMGKAIEAMMVDPSEYGHMRERLNVLAGMFFLEGSILFISAFIASYIFGIVADALQRTVRMTMLRQFMRMDASFFDFHENRPGALTTSLATEGSAIEGLGGITLGYLVQSCVMIVAGMITSLVVNWRVGLVGCACMPILVGFGFARYAVLRKLERRSNELYKSSGTLASQYITAIRTVQSLASENAVVDRYYELIDGQVKSSIGPYSKASVAYGFSQGVTPWVLGLMFWFASRRLADGNVTIFEFYVVLEAAVFASTTAGALFTYAPELAKGKRAGEYIWQILNTKPKIDIYSGEGKVLTGPINGDVEFRDVVFRYPSRPDVPVLERLNLKVRKGQYVALVGPSGSGKSTTIGLLERFYDPLGGEVTLDGEDIRSINLASLREHMSLVQQEPALYSGTIRENILLGLPGDDDSQATEAMLHDVCRKSNIHDFIVSLPDGYDTIVGARGVMLSGGQKQRIAIARALIRDPAVLLLDEATSALDSESERIVQQAIDKAALGRTTIAIAHRLATVRNADIIYVLDKGIIVESGNHEELIEKDGLYAELARLQSLSN